MGGKGQQWEEKTTAAYSQESLLKDGRPNNGLPFIDFPSNLVR